MLQLGERIVYFLDEKNNKRYVRGNTIINHDLIRIENIIDRNDNNNGDMEIFKDRIIHMVEV